MTQKKMFKVISPVEKKSGGTFWMRMGSAFVNKDDSINIYLDAWPKNFQLQLREMTDEDFSRSLAVTSSSPPPPSFAGSPETSSAHEPPPF